MRVLPLVLVLGAVIFVDGAGVPTPGRPHELIWQAPNGKCQRSWDIDFGLVDFLLDTNARNRYQGHSNAIFYYCGKWPHKELTTIEIVNGGVPQEGNMTLHYIDIIHDINDRFFLGVCSTDDGLCSSAVGCDGSEWICVEVPDWDNETRWNYPEMVEYEGRECVVTDPSSPLLGSTVCGYGNLVDCVPIDESVCGRVDRSYYSYATYNFEWWRPSWVTNWSPHLMFYRTMSTDILGRQLYPDLPRPLNSTIEELIRIQAIPLFEEWGLKYMVQSLQLAQKLRPNSKWGYYAYPYCFNSPASLDYSCKASTQDNNDWHAAVWKQADCLQPSVYLYYDVERNNAFTYHYAAYCEAIRSGMVEHGDDYQWPVETTQFWGDNDVPDNYWKCVVPYTTYKHGMIGLDPDLYRPELLKITLRLGAYCGFPASYIWGASAEYTDYINETTGDKYNSLCPIMRDYTVNQIGPYSKKIIEWAEECSTKRCSGQGRCAHKGCLCNNDAEATAMFDLDLDDFDTSDQTMLDEEYFCKCYPGFKGNHCQTPR